MDGKEFCDGNPPRQARDRLRYRGFTVFIHAVLATSLFVQSQPSRLPSVVVSRMQTGGRLGK